ncbi:hypothetical protein JAAARDRAFT_248354 [Jaapia argillacea MUCL 33604]|uniref:Uncharacterized protein n=1 Tax=Jaapia argillacea MUCL 33604 TaxID=933084 RepID=A0A067QNI1_9AGAM|nr:hypothetical protein JAAARDRAFT_248354 [Jaapia argillacea MUCL 33604]
MTLIRMAIRPPSSSRVTQEIAPPMFTTSLYFFNPQFVIVAILSGGLSLRHL